jgi:hypothetical protein
MKFVWYIVNKRTGEATGTNDTDKVRDEDLHNDPDLVVIHTDSGVYFNDEVDEEEVVDHFEEEDEEEEDEDEEEEILDDEKDGD